MISKYEIENWFTYHNDPNKVPKYKAIREAAKYLAQVIVDNAPECADMTAAIRKLRESAMMANAAIACDNDQPKAMLGGAGFKSAATNYEMTQGATSESSDMRLQRLENQLKQTYAEILEYYKDRIR